ncbi:methyltransferase domain-containing protein [Candidatus Woesearchaeota archaeon]|nr:methyltransferase domain-containing protein [Candidatus Woesearchaeota archaeon]
MTDYYDEISEGYDALHFEEQKKKAELILKELKIKKSDKLLDVGCGTGKITELFFCDATGIDPSEKLLAKAKIPVVKGNAEKLPFPDKSFDIVISLTAIHHADPKKAVEEIKRVAKRDIAISVLKKAKNFNEIEQEIQKQLIVKQQIDANQDILYICASS